MSSEEQLDEYSLDINEILGEIGTEIGFLRFKSSDGGLYGESKLKEFEESVPLLGYLKMRPDPEKLTPIGRHKQSTIEFTFDYKTLDEAGLIASPIVDNDRLSFAGAVYEINNVVGGAFLSGRFLVYHIEAKELS